MPAAPTAPGLHPQPDPDRAAVAVASARGRIGRLLNVVRKLVDYGKDLLNTLQARGAASAPGFAHLTFPFCTTDLKLIFARITCGLRRAAELEARLGKYAARDRDAPSPSLRTPSRRKAPTGQPAAAPLVERIEDPRLAGLPTAEQIAAEVRLRPVGVVIVDICRDLGITPENAGPMWRELSLVVMEYGGSFVQLFRIVARAVIWSREQQTLRATHAGFPPCTPSPACGSTGPP